MKILHAKTRIPTWAMGAFLAFALAAGGCVKLVADYDSATYEEIIRVAKEVDKFYGALLDRPEKDRAYKDYSGKYVDLEATIRSLYTRNLTRPLNKESTRISEIILDLWIKYKDRHKASDTYTSGNAKLDRKRFQHLFVSAANAEAAIKLEIDGKDAAK